MNIPALYSIYQQHPAISIDTRKITKGCLFFALKGAQFDANDFAQDAVDAGAAFAIVSDPDLKGPRFVIVEDPLETLQKLANYHRTQFSIPVLAITGSNGKTTTKELINLALRVKYKVHATVGNLNNHIGVPLTLLSMPADTELLVCEMGANHLHEIEFLCQLAEPTHGIITNIGKAHLEGFGGFEGVKKAKGELFDYLKANNGFAFVNMDDASLREISLPLKNKLSYSLLAGVDADFQFQCQDDSGTNGFTIKDQHGSATIHSNMFGFYNAYNLLAAYCVGKHFNVDEIKLIQHLSAFNSRSNRSEILEFKSCTIIKDAYNANPSSMELAIKAFGDRYPNGWIVLGDMKELGEEGLEAHRQIIQKVNQYAFEKVFLVGQLFKAAFQQSDLPDARYACVNSITELIHEWNWDAVKNHPILLKGSRSMHLEKLLGEEINPLPT